jgi:tRNA U34 5-carboxymethylaminomethyl modifying enzyme MnmG/GidA
MVMHFDLDALLLEQQAHLAAMSCNESVGGTGK